jgi:serine/threonine-protein kinase RsbT
MPETELQLPIGVDGDIVTARQEGRRLAATLSFSPSDLTVIATAISEVARNILTYAGEGQLDIGLVERSGRRGVTIIARDDGPGIPDVQLALEDGFSTSGGLGLGLPGARRLMDDFEIHTQIGHGTVVTMCKWAR